MLFSVLALLVVVAVLMKLSATQLQVLKPTSTPAATSGAVTSNPGARAVDQFNKAVEQGAARRAADAASQ